MAKPKIKIREIKKKIKITEIPKENPKDEQLEDIVFMDSDAPETLVASSSPTSPSLAQHLDDVPSQKNEQPQDTRPILRNGLAGPTESERAMSTAVNYATSQSTSPRRSYDSSIRAGEIAAAATTAATRINPSIERASSREELSQVTGRNPNALDLRDRDANERNEPALRKADENRDYSTTRAEEYISKRRKDLM